MSAFPNAISLNVPTLPAEHFASPLVDRALKDLDKVKPPTDNELAGAVGALNEALHIILSVRVNANQSDEAKAHAETVFEQAQTHVIRMLILRDKEAHPTKPLLVPAVPAHSIIPAPPPPQNTQPTVQAHVEPLAMQHFRATEGAMPVQTQASAPIAQK